MKKPATETAHVLMTDWVRYSPLSIEEKTALDHELKEAVLGCPAVARQDPEDCLKLDSGDGVSLVFFGEPTDAIEAAEYLHGRIREHAKAKLRIGLNTGLVTRREDANAKTNVTGPGIEWAQRAMACADGTQIVMTDYFAVNLRAFAAWRDRVADLGEQRTKHDEPFRLFALRHPVETGSEMQKLAIVYRRKAQPDDYVVDLLEKGLPEFGYRVFIDRHLSIGVEWAQAIEREIRGADAIVVVLSERAAASEMVLFELQTAIDQYQQTGNPKILPIRVGSDEPINGDVGAILNPFHFALWTGPGDDRALLVAIHDALTQPVPMVNLPRLERVGGAMPPDSPFYVVRPTDDEFVNALLEKDSIVLVKGARQIGKTSLMARALRRASESGSRVVWTDLQAFGRSQIQTDQDLYLAFAAEFVDQLGLQGDPFEKWRPMFGANTNFERFLSSVVFAQVESPIIWAIDEVDRLFTMPYSGDFFGMVRSWHNRRAARAEETWSRFSVALAYATEAHLFISDLNQSPFNVGTRLDLADFGPTQIEDLNNRYGRPLASESDVTKFIQTVGGQPYLCRRGFDEMVRNNISLTELVDSSAHEEGPFGDHLRRLLVALSGDPLMLEEVRKFLGGAVLSSEEVFFRLRSGGLISGSHRGDARLRCGIYGEYLRLHLLS
ncbi:MAG TPA: AAA-like domain-containing protein [Fimbriimonadaceae bacterium]|nr:AAA-like domain-containing protein [Fimbriimonadaceae bacterium]